MLLAAWHRAIGRRLAGWRLAGTLAPDGAFLPATAAAAPPLPAGHRAAVLARARAVALPDWHGPFDPGAPALGLDLFAPGDIRPVWERNRWAELPVLAQAARLDPGGGHLARAEALLADWVARNPPFRGPNWACGQEAALRVLNLALALGLLGAAPSPAACALLTLHGRRIAATPAYAAAQDNNHLVSEVAGLLACGLLLGEARWARRGAARLDAALCRLVAADGGFAPVSTGYHRLLLDVLASVEWLRRQHGGPPLAESARARAAAAVGWLQRLVDPATGAMPRLGHQDGSAFADLSLAGPDDARPSLERAARLLAGCGAGAAEDPGCAWLGLPPAAVPPTGDPPDAWVAGGLRGWRAGPVRVFLRTGPLRFRPGQADLLHLDLWDGPLNLLRDGGTGAYNPGAEHAWWLAYFAGTAAHNTIGFDAADQMPRVSRFLFACWPSTGLLPDGAWLRDHRGRRHARSIGVAGRRVTVEDRIEGPWREAALRWRLAPATWRPLPDGAESALGRLRIRADAPLACTLEAGWESPAYGVVHPAPVLVARMLVGGVGSGGRAHLETVIELPPSTMD